MSSKIIMVTILLIFGFVQANDYSQISLTTIKNDTISLDQLINKDQPTFFYFWATWCSSCKKEIPKITTLFEEFDLVTFIPIAYKDKPNAIHDYWISKQLSGETYHDFSGKIFEEFSVNLTPTVIIVNKKGEIVFSGQKSIRAYKKILLSLAQE